MINYDPSKTDWEKIKDGLKKYLIIMKSVREINVQTDPDFQRKFNGFYKVMRKPKIFYVALYECLENNKNKEVSFYQILEFFYQKFGNIEPSFSSKIIATINPNFPVWDKQVLERLNIEAPGYTGENRDRRVRFKNIVKTYDNIINWYSEFLKTEQAVDMIKMFDEKIGTTDITDTKKIDFIFWQTRSEK